MILSDRLEGEARDVGKALAGIALQAATHGQPLPPPLLLLSGGETTVTVRGESGRGGRNAEFLLGHALALGGHRLHPRHCRRIPTASTAARTMPAPI